MLGDSLTLTKQTPQVYAAQPPGFSGSFGHQKDATQPQGTREDLTCYRAQALALETS